MAEQKDIANFDRHLSKLFENIKSMFFETEKKVEEEDDIVGIISNDGERITLSRKVKHNAGAEIWLS